MALQYALYGCEQCPERREWVDKLPPLWWTRAPQYVEVFDRANVPGSA